MAHTSRASCFWENYGRMSFAGDLDTERGVEIDMDGEGDIMADGRTPLDKTIDRIGMGAFSLRIFHIVRLKMVAGSYQWTLLALCGFGEFLVLAPAFITHGPLRMQGGWLIM